MNKPFQKHQPMPTPQEQQRYTNMPWFRRHIIVDHPNRTIFIQVMWDGTGELKLDEARRILSGVYWEYIPTELVQPLREGISSGYQVRPMVFAGQPIGEHHAAFQIVSIDDARHHMTDQVINQPVADA